MSIALAVLLLSCLANLSLGFLIILRNPKRLVSRLFFLICLSFSAWTASNFLTEASYATLLPNDIFNRLAYLSGAMIVISIVLFCYSFQNETFSRPPKWFIIASILILPLSITDFVAGNVSTKDGELVFSIGPLLLLYGIFLLSCVALWIFKLIKIIRSTATYGYAHAQARLILFGATLSVIGAVTMNVLIPILVHSYVTAKFGPLFTIFIVYTTGYAIIKYRLFDVRLAITRFLGYAITIGIIAALYSLVLILFVAQLLDFDHLTALQIFILLIPTIIVALTFNVLAKLTARFTQRIFYHDAYDVREVLDQLSDALISENDIDKMMHQSLEVLTSAIKPMSVYFAVLNSSGVVYKHIQEGNQDLVDLAPFVIRLNKEHSSLIDREEAPSRTISKLMAKQNVELLLRLGPKDAPTGLMLIGAKRNGSMYTKQDISLLRIGAKNLGMALDNAKKYEQIIHFADTLHKEVNRATSRLRKANEELKTLDSLKDDFISTASHQLRSPAVSVHDALHMLNYPGVTKKDRDELLVLAESSSERLVTVVRTMLNMARIQSGRFTIDTSEVDIVELVEKEINQVKVLADQKSIRLHFEAPEQPIIVHVDIAKIAEAVANYIENAIKYSLDKTTVTIHLEQEGNTVRFEVADQGMGVPQEERSHLFGRFYRAANARQEQPDGNGIGLYVVKTIAEGHGGEAYYRPGQPRGSVFGFWIKLSPPKSKN